ncbi:hypothetical protein MMC34_007643 [Xylographa carneopallida]|nr:hypothetical protein [Xylographa carneopallida]
MLIRADEEGDVPRSAHLPSPHPTFSFWHNDPSPFLLHHRTTSELPKVADVVIIGSGISGTFAARKLLERPELAVVMLEAREACWGATGRNGGHCQPQLYENPADVASFQLRNFESIDALVRKHDIPCEWQRMPGGGCHAYFSQMYFEEAKSEVENLKQSDSNMGDTVRVVEDKKDLSILKIPTAVGAVIQSRAAKLSPYKLVSWILEDLVKNSRLNLQTSTPVVSLTPSKASTSSSMSKWTVQTPRGIVLACHVLITTNGYTSYLLPQFRSIIVPVRGEMSALRTPSPLLQQSLNHTYAFIGTVGQDRIQDDYLVQRPISPNGKGGGELMFGGGRTKAFHKGVNVDSDDTIDDPAAEYLRTKLPQVLDVGVFAGLSAVSNGQVVELPAKKEWTGIMGFSRDGHPWVGAVPGSPGLWLSGAYTGSGMPNAALSSQHAASLILAAHKAQDWTAVEQEAVRSSEVARGRKPEAMIIDHLLPILLPLLTLTAAFPTISVNTYEDTTCQVLDVEGYAFKHNRVCTQFIKQEGSFIATSKKPVKEGCVLQVFASTDCTDVLAAITVNAGCEAPYLGPASSGWVVDC